MIEKILFKQCEAIRLENEFLKVITLPSLGGKVASFFLKEKSFDYYFKIKNLRTSSLSFTMILASMMHLDLMILFLQSMNPLYKSEKIKFYIQTMVKSGVPILHMIYKVINYNFNNESKILSYQYIKTFILSGNNLIIDYRIINKGKDEFPCIWTMHCLMICEEDMQLIFPKDTQDILNVLESNFLGEAGRVHSYPITTSIQGSPYALNKVLPSSSNNMEKYYVKGAVSEGICGAYYPSIDVTYKLYYDKDKLPYLGFWVTEGGFRGDYNCALEPSNGYYDSIDIAKREQKLPVLKPNEIFEFTLKMELK